MRIKKTGVLKKELQEKHFRVAIFGSARSKRTSKEYKRIFKLGKSLGDRGLDIITGGGPGIMEAASRGHSKGKLGKKSHSIGLGIKLPHEQKTEKSIGVRKQFNRFSNRLDSFMLLSNVVVISPGGVGTLLEFFYTWQLMQVKQICNIPIILLGKQWPTLIKWLEKQVLKRKFVDKHDMNLLFLAKDCDEAVEMIDKAYEEYKKGTKNFCLNYKRYKLM